MNTIELLFLRRENIDKSLVFKYAQGPLAGTTYHIPEVKNMTIESIDFGMGSDFWKGTIVQLWKSLQDIGKKVYKA